MELAIARTVYNLAVEIITNSIAEQDDQDTVHQQILSIVTQIQTIIHPLLSRKITNVPLQQCLHGLQSVLSNTYEHMKAGKESRPRRMLALINPWTVTQQLKDNREQLMALYTLLMGAMQIVDHVKGYNLITPPPNVDRSPSQEGRKRTKGSEVLDFWEKCIGKEFGSVKGTYLCKQLSSWMGTKLDAVASRRLLLRLDHNNTGYVSLETLQDLVQNGNMKETVNTYSADPTLPLLIWIDDDILGKAPQALGAGITVVQIGSTSAAKTWILTNREFLKKHDNGADIRFVSNQVRTEFSSKGVSFKNSKAGQDITEFIRKEGFVAPILIFTTRWSIHLTRYVEAYKMVGSLIDHKAFEQYVDALAARRNDDTQWVKYGGSWGFGYYKL
ncbi:hypothetical protein BYT27DRAFT_7137322 [Phlegmacium glaucopus]|nr:hypothetical protein BYT27DRAFT_7137322 [Phlegmacium glaucopus]